MARVALHFLAHHNRGAGPKVSALHTEGAADQTLLAAAIELARADSRSWCAGAKARRLGWIRPDPLAGIRANQAALERARAADRARAENSRRIAEQARRTANEAARRTAERNRQLAERQRQERDRRQQEDRLRQFVGGGSRVRQFWDWVRGRQVVGPKRPDLPIPARRPPATSYVPARLRPHGSIRLWASESTRSFSRQ